MGQYTFCGHRDNNDGVSFKTFARMHCVEHDAGQTWIEFMQCLPWFIFEEEVCPVFMKDIAQIPGRVKAVEVLPLNPSPARLF